MVCVPSVSSRRKAFASTSPWSFRRRRRSLVAKAGAYFVSPFLGRLDDIGENGLVLLPRDPRDLPRTTISRPQVLAASLRSPIHILEAAKMGSHIGTMPFKVFQQLFQHPLTDKGLQSFLKDWEKAREVLGDIMKTTAGKSGR